MTKRQSLLWTSEEETISQSLKAERQSSRCTPNLEGLQIYEVAREMGNFVNSTLMCEQVCVCVTQLGLNDTLPGSTWYSTGWCF